MDKTEKKWLSNAAFLCPKGGVIVELGSYLGKSAFLISQGIREYDPTITLFCVDHFKGHPKEDTEGEKKVAEVYRTRNVRDEFEDRLKDCPHTTIVEDTVKAAERFDDKSVDLVYIDADHLYEGVRKDIDAWMPKIKPGGYMAGHDYGGYYEGVKRAVDETFGDKITMVARSIWCWHNEVMKCASSVISIKVL